MAIQQILTPYGPVNLVMESNIYTLPAHFFNEAQGVCLASSILLDYFDQFPFDNQELVIKELELTIFVDLYLIMGQSYAQEPFGIQFQQFALQHFLTEHGFS